MGEGWGMGKEGRSPWVSGQRDCHSRPGQRCMQLMPPPPYAQT